MIKLKIILVFSVLLYVWLFIDFYEYKGLDVGDASLCVVVNDVVIGDKVVIYTNGLVITYYDFIDIKIGDTVCVEGDIDIPYETTLFNQFSYKNYLLSKKIYNTMVAFKIEIVDRNISIINKFKYYLYELINQSENEKYLRIFILGDKSLLDDDILEAYQENGISHLLCISGMHISLLASVLNKVFKKHSLISLILLFYGFVIGFSASVFRAVWMFILSKWFKGIDILLFLSIVLLLYNPFIIYDVGFCFSFIISFYLILCNNIICKFKNYIMKIFVTSLLCFVVSLPISVISFHYINLLSPILNIIFVPFVSFLLFPACLLSFIPLVDNCLSYLIEIFEWLNLFVNEFNLIYSMKSIGIMYLIFYYIIITFILLKRRYFFIILIILLIHINYKFFINTNYLTMIDVGQGDSFLLETNSKNILIDTGGFYSSSYSIAKSKTIAYLRSRGINKIDYLIITHGDYDHGGEAISLIENFNVEHIIFNSSNDNDLEIDIMMTGVDYTKMSIGKLDVGDIVLEFLNAGSLNENEDSLVFFANIKGNNLLFTGDIGFEVENYLMTNYELPAIDYFKVGHHGSKNSTSLEFVEFLNPRVSLISVGVNNRYGHPASSVLSNLEKSEIYMTSINGSVLINLNNNKIKNCYGC